MNIKCPHCETEYEVEKKDMFRYAYCETCGKGFVIGTTTSQLSSDEPTAQMNRQSVARLTSPLASSIGPIPRSCPFAWEICDGTALRVGATGADGQGNQEVPNHAHYASSDISLPFTEKECFKTWMSYWVARLIVGIVISLSVGFMFGFVSSVSGSVVFAEWPREMSSRLAHWAAFLFFAIAIYISLRLCWWCYMKFVVRGLFHGRQVVNVLTAWLVPIVINFALGLLMPINLQISVFGVCGVIVWALTIWVLVDYCMIRFITVKLLCGQKIDYRWILPAILFCIFIVMLYGFSHIVK